MEKEIYFSLEDAGIRGVNSYGSNKQHTVCPRCSADRKKKRAHCLTVWLNNSYGGANWICNHAECGWRGHTSPPNPFKKKIKPSRKIEQKFDAAPDKFYEYFERKRGITRAVFERNHIKRRIYLDKESSPPKNVGIIAFPYYEGEDVVNIKYRKIEEKQMWLEQDAKLIFYKINDIVGETWCVITEGEFDALAFEVAGIKNAISVPNGSASLVFLDNCLDYIAAMEVIYLAVDNDAPGRKLMHELGRRLGPERCRVIQFPEGVKDANEMLLKYGAEQLAALIQTAKDFPMGGIADSEKLIEDITYVYHNWYEPGAKTGILKFDDHICFYRGNLTIVTGISSHGKSCFLDFVSLKIIIENDWRFGVFSSENYPLEVHLHRLLEQYIGKSFNIGAIDRMTEEEMLEGAKFITDHYFFIDLPRNERKLSAIFDRIRYLVRRHGIHAAIIDPYNQIEHIWEKGENETLYTSRILSEILAFAQQENIHIFLVVHPTKIPRGSRPSIRDASGSATFHSKADNALVVYRNEDDSVTIIFEKIKHAFMGHLGEMEFGFHKINQRYSVRGFPAEVGKLRKYIPASNVVLPPTQAEMEYKRKNFQIEDDFDAPF